MENSEKNIFFPFTYICPDLLSRSLITVAHATSLTEKKGYVAGIPLLLMCTLESKLRKLPGIFRSASYSNRGIHVVTMGIEQEKCLTGTRPGSDSHSFDSG